MPFFPKKKEKAQDIIKAGYFTFLNLQGWYLTIIKFTRPGQPTPFGRSLHSQSMTSTDVSELKIRKCPVSTWGCQSKASYSFTNLPKLNWSWPRPISSTISTKMKCRRSEQEMIWQIFQKKIFKYFLQTLKIWYQHHNHCKPYHIYLVRLNQTKNHNILQGFPTGCHPGITPL